MVKMAKKRKRFPQYTCPISLDRVSCGNMYIHDDQVFSKSDLVSYLKCSGKFENPVTRSKLSSLDVEILGDPDLSEMYDSSHAYLKRSQEDSSLFFFLESEVQDLLVQGDIQAFKEACAKMVQLDPARAICVKKFLNMSNTSPGARAIVEDAFDYDIN
ncbi:unknown [Feldmannia species virus]|uniref:Uncharacterized protein n=1 Tax=Feldmannia species virus TaxID=39420 RepID=B5LWG7_9PHYC|nr:hypothetical protein FeldSpV_gp078 [Feldmannia species virus]ACH46830.1 unknown [Feldmannia species virus]